MAQSATSTFRLDARNISVFLEMSDTKLTKAMNKTTRTWAQRLESYMKILAPWQDQTGLARKSLTARAKEEEQFVWTIELAQNVDYGIYLEYAHEKRFAVLEPVLQAYSGDVMNGFHNFLDNFR